MKINLKNLLPHLIAIVSFAVITMAYFLPLLSGKQISQHDIMQWIGMSKEIVDYRNQFHEEPLWTGSMFSGMPAYQISVVYDGNLIRYVNAILTLGLPVPADFIFMMLLGFYLLLISLKIDFRLCIAGAIGFAFSTYHFVIINAGHNSKAHAIALMPLVIAGVLMTLRGKLLTGGIITAIALSLEIMANHLQITYYLFMIIILLLIAELIKSYREKNTGHYIKSGMVLGLAAVFGILTNITNLWATYEYGKYSTRSQSELTAKKASSGLDKDYALQYSYGVAEAPFTLFIPRFNGGASSESLGKNSATYQALRSNGVPDPQAMNFIANVPLYFGKLYSTSGPPYAGAIMFFLFFLGLFVVKGPMKWWITSATALSLILSWGKFDFTHLTDLFFDHFPGYNKFRAVSMILVIAEFCIPLLGIIAFKKMTDGSLSKEACLKYLKYSFYISGGICAMILIVPGIFSDFTGSSDEGLKQYEWLLAAIREDRISAVRMDALRSLFFIFCSAALLWAYLNNKMKKLQTVYFTLAVLILVDMWMVGKRYLNDDHFIKKSKAEQPFVPTDADLQILADKDPNFRVMNTTVSTFNDAGTSYYHKSIGGYHGAKLKRYQELIEYQISNNNQAVMNMLNTKYFIFQPKQGNAPVAQFNPDACGSVWFVNEIKMVANADSEITALSDFKPKETVFVDNRFVDYVKGFQPAPDSAATIKLLSYLPNKLNYESNAQSEQFAVFSEVYYDKGWNVYIDGKLSQHIRVNYVLRGMRVPAGNHKIEFRFEPEVYHTGERISLASSALLLLLLCGIIFTELRKKNL